VIAAAALRMHPNIVLAAIVLPLTLVAFQRTLLAWPTLIGLILVVILLIPIRRYEIGGNLPIELEPYRVLIAVVLLGWLCALCADPDVRWRATGLEGPVLTVLAAIMFSLALNVPRVTDVADVVIKQVSFFFSFFLVTYLVASVVSKGRVLDGLLRLLVGTGAALALLSLFEWRTGINVFNSLDRLIPFLHYVPPEGLPLERGAGFRATGSAQHPIALGAFLIVLLPLTVYLYRRDDKSRWLLCGGLLMMGALATGSRTAAVMLMAVLVVFLWLKWSETVRLAPLLVPLIIAFQIVMPGTLGTFRVLLNPGYVIKEQSIEMGTGSGRIADLGPSLAEWSRQPFLGQGFGTRVVSQVGTPDGAQILDDQWLGALLEIGAVGVLGLLWLFWRAVRRLKRVARSEDEHAWLAASLAAALIAYAVGMLTYDAFAFVQVTFLAFVLLGFTAVVTRRG
jgi:hypothetical protein